MAPATIVVAILAIAFWQFDALREMVNSWLEREEYSHGMLLPFLAAWIAWQQRDVIASRPVRGTWAGIVLTVGSAIVVVMGDLATLYSIVQYGVVGMICGLIVSWIGVDRAKAIWLPLLLLVLMVPLPNFILNGMSANLQILSSHLAVGMMRLVGISVYVEGNVIDLGSDQLQVAEACDGLRYLFPLMTLAFVMAYLFKAGAAKRTVLFLSSIPIAIFMNSVRVAAIGVMVERWGIGMAEGLLHDFQGWVVFMMSAGVLFAEMMLLSSLGRDGGHWRTRFGLDALHARTKDDSASAFDASLPRFARVSPGLVCACAITFVIVATGALVPERAEAVPQRAHLAEFPMRHLDWAGRRDALDAVYLDVLKLDDYLLADFKSEGTPPVNLYVAYYDSQRKGQSAHSPRSCIPGGGWEIESITSRDLELPGASDRRTINRVVVRRGEHKQIVYYWFEQRGRVLHNEYLVKWFIFWDALTRNRTDGAMVRLTAPQLQGQTEAQVDEALSAFAQDILPPLAAYLPG